MNKEIERLNQRLNDEAFASSMLQDALECILEVTDDDPVTIAQETLEALAHYRKGD